ncbi:MAG: hypothetical protein K0B37_15865 [Bacteroidales bacterium]|nr:hypothetical protein [Bacteroidales bacterium]
MKVNPIYLIALGVMLILVGIFIKRNDPGTKSDEIEIQETVLNAAGESVSEAEEINAKANQDAFEQYVANKFSARYFNVERIVPEEDLAFSNLRADYNISGKQGSIYLNTTWIFQYVDHTLEVANNEELSGFKAVIETNAGPAFKIIGIGGRPDNPRLLYIIPAKEITQGQKRIFEIVDYKKENLQSNFFFDLNEMTLK